MAMQQQLPHITILWTRYPDSRKAIFQQQLPHKSGIFAVVLLLPDARGPNLCRVSHPQFEAQLGQQALEPTGVPRGLHPHSHLDSSLLQLAIEPFGFSIAVHQPLLATFPSFRVCPSDLLYAWVIIATYNEHLGSFLPSPWSFCTTKCTQIGGSRCLHEINYSLKHARSGSDRWTVSNSPLINATSPLLTATILPLSDFHKISRAEGPKRTESKITAPVLGWLEDSVIRSDSRDFGVAESFSTCADIWIVW